LLNYCRTTPGGIPRAVKCAVPFVQFKTEAAITHAGIQSLGAAEESVGGRENHAKLLRRQLAAPVSRTRLRHCPTAERIASTQ